jgi:hypothetical protein
MTNYSYIFFKCEIALVYIIALHVSHINAKEEHELGLSAHTRVNLVNILVYLNCYFKHTHICIYEYILVLTYRQRGKGTIDMYRKL